MGGVLAASAIALLIILNTGTTDSFQFLEDAQLVARFVEPPMGESRTHEVIEGRIYNLDLDHEAAYHRAFAELEAAGFAPLVESSSSEPTWCMWRNDMRIIFVPGMSANAEQALGAREKRTPDGTTVLIANNGPYTGLNWIRTWFDPDF